LGEIHITPLVGELALNKFHPIIFVHDVSLESLVATQDE
jgi:hypothetical protein